MSEVPSQETERHTYVNRYPRPDEMCAHTGQPGVKYCFVAGHRQRLYHDRGFWLVKGTPEAIRIVGPSGTIDTVVVMGKGTAIRGAGDQNGVRRWGVDPEVERITGLPADPKATAPEEPPAPAAEVAKEKARAAPKG